MRCDPPPIRFAVRAMRDPTQLAAAAFDKLRASGLSDSDIRELLDTLRAKVEQIGTDDPAEVLKLVEQEILRQDLERN